jgi:hypothetical protein
MCLALAVLKPHESLRTLDSPMHLSQLVSVLQP